MSLNADKAEESRHLSLEAVEMAMIVQV